MRALASHLTGILALALVAPVVLFITSCSSEAAQLSITLSSTFGASYTPGATDADFQMRGAEPRPRQRLRSRGQRDHAVVVPVRLDRT